MSAFIQKILQLLFPPKCLFCQCLLDKEQTDLCSACRRSAPVMKKPKFKISFVAGWTSVWYYKDAVRDSILRYKFAGRRQYAQGFGQQLGMRLLHQELPDIDCVTYVPVSIQRRLQRGYDQSALLAQAVSRELALPLRRCLRKRRNTPPQTSFRDISQRRANVEGAFRVTGKKWVTGKRILLIDDIVTTGATMSECAKQLQFAGCLEVYGAAVAAAPRENKINVGEINGNSTVFQ